MEYGKLSQQLNENMKLIERLITAVFFFFILLILLLSVRGLPGVPNETELNLKEWSDSGPFELSPERARFALTYSILENKSIFLDNELAKFSLPDLGYVNGKFVSLFVPGISYLLIPGFYLGKLFNATQLGGYLVITLFAFLNTIVIYKICLRLTSNKAVSLISSGIFIFATPAFTYAVSLFQHHVSTFLLLLACYILLTSKRFLGIIFVFFICSLSIIIDFPNFFMLLPVGILGVVRLFNVAATEDRIRFTLSLKQILPIIAILIPLSALLLFNKYSYGNPFKLSGSVTQLKKFEELSEEESESSDGKSISGLFNLSYIPQGAYEHLLSVDRGLLFFTPVLIFGLLGINNLRKKNKAFTYLLLSVTITNISLYSSFGIGGWSFGSRYLVPSYAMLSILLSTFLSENKNKFLFAVFYLALIYSVAVNTAGAISSSKNPPKYEAIGLQLVTGRTELYSFDRNILLIFEGKSKSFVFQNYLKSYTDARTFYIALVALIVLVLSLPTLIILTKDLKNNYEK